MNFNVHCISAPNHLGKGSDPQKQANAPLNLDNSSLKNSPKLSWQASSPPPPHLGKAQMEDSFFCNSGSIRKIFKKIVNFVATDTKRGGGGQSGGKKTQRVFKKMFFFFKTLLTATDCHRLPQTATDGQRRPQTATDGHRLPRLCLDKYILEFETNTFYNWWTQTYVSFLLHLLLTSIDILLTSTISLLTSSDSLLT